MRSKTALASVLAAIISNNGTAIDDRDRTFENPEGTSFKPFAIANFGEDTVLLYRNSVFCLNVMYVGNDGQAHLSAITVCGDIDSRECLNLQQLVNEFNQTRTSPEYKRLTDLTYL